MRDFTHWDSYLTELSQDIYAQPPDADHLRLTELLLNSWLPRLADMQPKRVLDVGCGQGLASAYFTAFGWQWQGITLGPDFLKCKEQGLDVACLDFSFLPYPESSFDLVYARHTLEHSYTPILTLMEWWRVSKFYLILVVPALEHYAIAGRNHPCLLLPLQWKALLFRTGWKVVWEISEDPSEYWFLCDKRQRNPPPDYAEFLKGSVST